MKVKFRDLFFRVFGDRFAIFFVKEKVISRNFFREIDFRSKIKIKNNSKVLRVEEAAKNLLSLEKKFREINLQHDLLVKTLFSRNFAEK